MHDVDTIGLMMTGTPQRPDQAQRSSSEMSDTASIPVQPTKQTVTLQDLSSNLA